MLLCVLRSSVKSTFQNVLTELHSNWTFTMMTAPESPMTNQTGLPHFTLKPWDVIGPLMMGLVGGPGLSGLVVQTNTSLGELFPSTLEANSWGKKKKLTNLTLFPVTVLHRIYIIKENSMSHSKIVCGMLITADCQHHCSRNLTDFPTSSPATDDGEFTVTALLFHFSYKKRKSHGSLKSFTPRRWRQ